MDEGGRERAEQANDRPGERRVGKTNEGRIFALKTPGLLSVDFRVLVDDCDALNSGRCLTSSSEMRKAE